MKRSLVVCSLLCLVALCGGAHASVTGKVTAKVTSPSVDKEADGQNYWIWTTSAHTFEVSGGTNNQIVGVDYDCDLWVDTGAGFVDTYGTTITVHLDSAGKWSGSKNLQGLTYGVSDSHEFAAGSSMGVSGNSYRYVALDLVRRVTGP